MSEFRRMLMSNSLEQNTTYDPSLIFYAPLTKGDLTDHITNIEMKQTGFGGFEWNDNLSIYKITTPGTTYNTVLSFTSDRLWKNYISSEYTVCIKVCRFKNNYGTRNACRVIACGPEGGPTDAWVDNGMGVPANMFAVGGAIDHTKNALGASFDTIHSMVTTYHFTGQSTYYQNRGPFSEMVKKYYTDGKLVFTDVIGCAQFDEYSNFDNSGLNIGLAGHANYRNCSFGIKEIRIYNRILTQQEIEDYSDGS